MFSIGGVLPDAHCWIVVVPNSEPGVCLPAWLHEIKRGQTCNPNRSFTAAALNPLPVSSVRRRRAAYCGVVALAVMCLTNSRNCCLSAPAKPDVLDCVAFDGSRWRAGQDLQLVIVRGRLAVAVGLASEQTARLVGGRGVRTSVVRLPQVHNPVKQGFVSFMIAVAREKGASAYVGEGNNRWSAAHRLDVARLYRLALEKAAAENAPVERYHAVAEEGVRIREIAEAIGRGLKLPVVAIAPEQAMQHFGFLGGFAGLDMPASSALTQERLGWHLTGPSLLADLEAMNFNV
jgi:hypothetical protein